MIGLELLRRRTRPATATGRLLLHAPREPRCRIRGESRIELPPRDVPI